MCQPVGGKLLVDAQVRFDGAEKHQAQPVDRQRHSDAGKRRPGCGRLPQAEAMHCARGGDEQGHCRPRSADVVLAACSDQCVLNLAIRSTPVKYPYLW